VVPSAVQTLTLVILSDGFGGAGPIYSPAGCIDPSRQKTPLRMTNNSRLRYGYWIWITLAGAFALISAARVTTFCAKA
jgi:hypothetical protein